MDETSIEIISAEIAARIDGTVENLEELPLLYVRLWAQQNWDLSEWQAHCSRFRVGRLGREEREKWRPYFEGKLTTGFAAAAMGISDRQAREDKNPSLTRESGETSGNPTEPVDNTEESPEPTYPPSSQPSCTIPPQKDAVSPCASNTWDELDIAIRMIESEAHPLTQKKWAALQKKIAKLSSFAEQDLTISVPKIRRK